MALFKFIMIGLLVLTPPQEDWVKIRGDQHISFLFPNRGQRVKKDTKDIHSWIFQTKNITCVFGVVCTQLVKEKGVLDAFTLNQLYLKMKKESVSMPSARLTSERTIPQRNMDIKEITYTIMKDDHEMTYYKRFIFRDNYMYQITIGCRTGQMNELLPQKDKFFNSVTFDEDNRKK